MELAKELILAVKKKEVINGNEIHKECEALMKRVLENMVKSKIPNLELDVKNQADSDKYREEGNQHFVSGDDDEAIEKYTMSLSYATHNELVANACANRSAALYRKNLFHQCLIDIDAALTYGYPESKRKKLQERAQKSVQGLKALMQNKDQNMNDLKPPKDTDKPTSISCDDEVSEKNLTILNNFISGEIDASNIHDNIKKDINDWISESLRAIPRYLSDGSHLNVAYGPSKECPALSSGAAIAYSEKYGRHLVATKPFEPGAIIALEEPFAYIVYREKSYRHCNQCLNRTYNLLPCPKCPLAQYCSEQCKDDAWEMAHKIECPVFAVLSKLLNLDMDKIRILTKIIRFLIMATKCGSEIDKLRSDVLNTKLNRDFKTMGFTDDGTFDSHSPRSALSLATNLSTRPVIDISAFSCISVLAAILLATKTNFFGKKYKSDQLKNITKNNNVVFCSAILFRASMIESSNSFSVQLDSGDKCGSGLFVAHSLLNHSCAPNTFRQFYGLTMITRALYPIKAGEQVFTSYGGGFPVMSRSNRRTKMLKEYFFHCDCPACEEDWPTYNEILKNHVGSIANTNKELVEKLKPFRKRLLKNKYDIDSVRSVLNILYSEVKMPCEEIVHATEYLRSYYLDPVDAPFWNS